MRRISKDGRVLGRACGHPSSFESLRTAAIEMAVADFDALSLPKSGKPDFGGRAPQDEGLISLPTLV